MFSEYRKSVAAIVIGVTVLTAGYAPDERSAATNESGGVRAVAATPGLSTDPPAGEVESLRLVVAPTGDEVRYRIREQGSAD